MDYEMEELLAYLDGELDDVATFRVKERLANDPTLCDLLIELAKDESQLEQWIQLKTMARQFDNRVSRTRFWNDDGSIGFVSALLVAGYILLPPLAVASSVELLSDYGMALQGWERSAKTVTHLSAVVTMALMALALFILACRARHSSQTRRLWLSAVGGSASLAISVVASHLNITGYSGNESLRREEMIQNHRWITYDSVFFWPKDLHDLTGRAESWPNSNQIRFELETLRTAGFDGLLIQGSHQIEVAKIARVVGFTAIIQSIYITNPLDFEAKTNQDQIRKAISVSEYVDGYVFGEFSAREVDLIALKTQLARIRWKTGRPVTTSFVHDDYVGKRGEPVRDLEDFAVPALARPWEGNQGDPRQAVEAVRQALASMRDYNKPALLTYVFYPSGGGPGFSEADQFTFFDGVLRLRIPRGVNIVFFSSFDRPWAATLSELSSHTPAFEAHTGLMAVRFKENGVSVEFVDKKVMELFRPSGSSTEEADFET